MAVAGPPSSDDEDGLGGADWGDDDLDFSPSPAKVVGRPSLSTPGLPLKTDPKMSHLSMAALGVSPSAASTPGGEGDGWGDTDFLDSDLDDDDDDEKAKTPSDKVSGRYEDVLSEMVRAAQRVAGGAAACMRVRACMCACVCPGVRLVGAVLSHVVEPLTCCRPLCRVGCTCVQDEGRRLGLKGRRAADGGEGHPHQKLAELCAVATPRRGRVFGGK
jgi:hypothetical protein